VYTNPNKKRKKRKEIFHVLLTIKSSDYVESAGFLLLLLLFTGFLIRLFVVTKCNPHKKCSTLIFWPLLMSSAEVAHRSRGNDFSFSIFFLFPSHTFILTVNETQQLLRGE
jgi:hypothetical protein